MSVLDMTKKVGSGNIRHQVIAHGIREAVLQLQ